MTEAVTATRRSRITPEREAELYEAVLDLLREVGYDALTMDAVAARTRSSKATLYRQWGGKAQLVVMALRHSKRGHVEHIDTGSLRGDLHALVALEDDCTMERNSALMRGVAMAMHHNDDLREAFRAQLVDPEMPGDRLPAAHDGRRLRHPGAAGRPATHPGLPHLVHRRRGPPRPRRLLTRTLPSKPTT
jgi:AcrR family transcriptional regulator